MRDQNNRTEMENTQKTTDDANYDLSPPTPVLQDTSRQALEAFSVNAGDLDVSREIKLTVEFPTQVPQDCPNNVALYFKKLQRYCY